MFKYKDGVWHFDPEATHTGFPQKEANATGVDRGSSKTLYLLKQRPETYTMGDARDDYWAARNKMILNKMILNHSKPKESEHQMTTATNQDNFFMMYGEPFMKVQPVEALQRSKTITAALRRGDQFAVNMNTQALTIITKAKMDAYYASLTFKIQVKLSDDRIIDLPTNSIEAFRQTLDDMASTHNMFNCLVFSETTVTPVGFPRHKPFSLFVDECCSFYKVVAMRSRNQTKGAQNGF